MRSIQKSSTCVLGVFFSLLLFLSFAFVSPLHAEILDVVDSQETTDVFLYVGDLVTVKVYSLTRIAVGNPGIVDINSVTADEIVLVGRKVGETSVYAWDEFGKKKITARVFAEDLGVLADELPKVLAVKGFKGLSVEKDYYLGKVVVSGSLPKADKKRLDEILKSSEDTIRNYVQEESDLIQIDVQISELNTTLLKALGFDWTTAGINGLSLSWQETLPESTGKFKDLFKIGDFNRTTTILNTVNLIIQEGKGRILSKPSIIVTSGEEATFLVGGELPIRTITTISGTSNIQETITFKQYGIELTVTPEIKGGKIDVKLDVSTRDIDAANTVSTIAAFITRSAETRLLLEDNQTIVLAGLIKQNRTEIVKRVPFLSSIPVVGNLFRMKFTPSANQDQELVISLTPKILKKQAAVEEAKKEEMNVETESPTPEAGEEIALPAEDAIEEPMPDENEPPVVEEPTEGIPDDKSGFEATVTTPDVPPMELTPMEEEETKSPSVPPDESAVVPPGPSSAAEVFPSPEPDSEAVKQYTEKVGTQIAQAISYPYEAKEYGWTGTVVLNIIILNDGNVKDVSIKASSGHAVFDKDAINTAKILSPYDPLPSDWNSKEISISVPVVYSEKPVLESAP